jgi:hypothetical protein
VNRIQNEGRRVTYAEVITTGQKKLFEKVTGKPYQTVALNTKGGSEAAPAMMSGGDSMMMMSNGVRTEKVIIPGYDRKELTKEEKAGRGEKASRRLCRRSRVLRHPEGKERKSYINAREQIAATPCVPPSSKAPLRAATTSASSARATVRPSKTPTTTPACPRRSP